MSQDNLFQVKIKGKWGFIDQLGSLVKDARYDDVRDFSEGLSGVEINER